MVVLLALVQVPVPDLPFHPDLAMKLLRLLSTTVVALALVALMEEFSSGWD